jgi:hypothetical protein
VAIWDRVTGGIASFGVGAASADAITPVLEGAKQQARGQRAIVVLAPALAADAAARRYDVEIDGTGSSAVFRSLDDAGHMVSESRWPVIEVNFADDAKRSGIGQRRYLALRRFAQRVPPFEQLLTLARRGRIDQVTLDSALAQNGIPAGLWPALRELVHEHLSPQDVALGVQRGVLPNVTSSATGEPLLPVGPTSETGKVAAMPQANVDVLATARAHGLDFDELAVLARNAGLSPGVGELLQLLNRGAILEADYRRGISEGDTRNEWASALLELRHRLITPEQAATARLKGWRDPGQAAELGALSGASAETMELLYLIQGRPIAPVQAFTAIARGAPGPYGGTFGWDDFDTAIRQSDIRPEYAKSLRGIYHAYPSLFQLRQAVTAGALTPARALTILGYERYEDQDAQALVTAWTTGGTSSTHELTRAELVREYSSGLVERAAAERALELLGYPAGQAAAELELADYQVVRASLTAAESKLRSQFVGWHTDRQTASNELDALGVTATARDRSLSLWDQERETNRPRLTAVQVADAAKKEIWTAPDAYAELVGRGYSDRDARTLLALHSVTMPA